MCTILRVRWTLTPLAAPRPWLACSGCGVPRAFETTGKIRLNANGRKLDAWLIYACTSCEKTWNRPIFERQPLRAIEPSLLARLQANDPELARAESFNLDALRRKALRIEEYADVAIDKQVVDEMPRWTRIEIAMVAPHPVDLRLDRLLARELPLSRSGLPELERQGRLRIAPSRGGALRRRIGQGLVVILDIADAVERGGLWRAAAAGASP
ncbi:hypothetical protein BTR14_16825 [Rhizobium rhizosphaerae]|uniref:DUF1062 domain-containing protein n=1 Tax=Xaviernesmea rhizosphaerae TaxID=1672749 RepID=A0ABX3P9F7_9HYPH|nr:hypothetical protein BTR14_16825 [Xaviernesmea rhizosphaerae]